MDVSERKNTNGHAPPFQKFFELFVHKNAMQNKKVVILGKEIIRSPIMKN